MFIQLLLLSPLINNGVFVFGSSAEEVKSVTPFHDVHAAVYFTQYGCGYNGFDAGGSVSLGIAACVPSEDSAGTAIGLKRVQMTDTVVNSGVTMLQYNITHYKAVNCSGTPYAYEVDAAPASCSTAAKDMGYYYYANYTKGVPATSSIPATTVLSYYTSATCHNVDEYIFAPPGLCIGGTYKYSCSGTSVTRTTYAENGCTGTYTTDNYSNANVCPTTAPFFLVTCAYPATAKPSIAPNSTCAYPKPDDDSKSMVCFAADETVQLESGSLAAIKDVRLGDRILSSNLAGEFKYAEVIAIPHAANSIQATFVTVSTSSLEIKLTADHLLLAGACDLDLVLTRAADVSVGLCVMTAAGLRDQVTETSVKTGRGVYTVVTTEELVVVSGIVASPFAVNHAAPNAFYNVVRFMHAVLPAAAGDVIRNGVKNFGALFASWTSV